MKKQATIIFALSLAVVFCLGILLGIGISAQQAEDGLKPPLFSKVRYYKNGVLWEGRGKPGLLDADVKELHYTGDKTRFISHSQGYTLDLPADSEPDFSLQEFLCRFKSGNTDIIISREEVPEEFTADVYMDTYINRYLLRQTYLNENNITLHKNALEYVEDYKVQIVALERTPAEGSEITQNTYVYCYIFTEPKVFYRILFKTEVYDEALVDQVYKTLKSFSLEVPKQGYSRTVTDFHPVLPENWTAETRALYDSIANAEKIQWGAFVPRSVREQEWENVDLMEEQIDYELKILLEYGCHFDPFPTAGMQNAYDHGKVVEFTMHVATAMNENLAGQNPALEVLDGVHDETLRQFARDAKAFGKPFLFRLNNEMNSDWVSFGAPATMNDPDVFIGIWRRIYRIFEEEGVNNAIWIFNPNNNSFPPQNYNHMLAYYPGNGYVHMFGITGYNTGTYYAAENNEKWFEFEQLYDRIHYVSDPYFGKFPWIITEFGSSSIGGDKPQWIRSMFDVINKYGVIKAAVWFNADDMDPRPEFKDVAARPYRLDETPETIEAFREGLQAFK